MSSVHLSPWMLEVARAAGVAVRCPLCRTLVLGDDAVGLTRGRVAHAECVLHEWAEGDPRGSLPHLPIAHRTTPHRRLA